MGGLQFGIDFKGGSLQEIEFEEHVTKDDLNETFQSLDIHQLAIQESDSSKLLLRFENISEKKHQELLTALAERHGQFTEDRFEAIGPTIGQELRKTSTLALILVAIGIIIYVAYVFRKVSFPVKSWKYGIAAIIALLHDIIIVTGLFAVLGYFFNVEIDLLFVTALLTILGFSVNDTIVVFDRIRENLLKKSVSKGFQEIVSISTKETITRSLNTSLTTLLVLLALYFFGGESIQWFIVALIAGVIAGTYSSIFIASALLVSLEKYQQKKNA
jgi:preprotein translocase subunit SecF